MAVSSRSRRSQVTNYWPGFVDALSSLLLVIIFMLSLFMLSQFFLGQEILGKDTAMSRLNSQIAELTELQAALVLHGNRFGRFATPQQGLDACQQGVGHFLIGGLARGGRGYLFLGATAKQLVAAETHQLCPGGNDFGWCGLMFDAGQAVCCHEGTAP